MSHADPVRLPRPCWDYIGGCHPNAVEEALRMLTLSEPTWVNFALSLVGWFFVFCFALGAVTVISDVAAAIFGEDEDPEQTTLSRWSR